MLSFGHQLGISPIVDYLIATAVVAVFACLIYYVRPGQKQGIKNAEEISLVNRLRIGRRLLVEDVYTVFRFGAQNKPLLFCVIVLTVIVGGLHLGIVGENQTFSFVYATLLFFQILVLQKTHLLELGENTSETPDEDRSEFIKRNQKVWNAGTDHAQNVRITYSIFNGDGKPLDTGKEIDLDPEDRSIGPGHALADSVSFRYDPMEAGVDGDIPHYIRIVTQTGSGISLLTDTKWVTIE